MRPVLWLYSKHRLLNGERAIDLINRGEADKILAVIESLDEGSLPDVLRSRVHDRSVLDALEQLDPQPFDLDVWPVARKAGTP